MSTVVEKGVQEHGRSCVMGRKTPKTFFMVNGVMAVMLTLEATTIQSQRNGELCIMLLTEYLERKGVRYWEAGSKNVGKGSIGIKCPFCRDHSNHCSIRLNSGHFKCWVCNEGGSFRKLLVRLGESYSSSREILQRLVFEEFHDDKTITAATGNLQELMEDFRSPLTKEHKTYLAQRNYDADLLQRRYSLFSSSHAGNFRHRLIIPVIMKRKTVGFIGRDVTGRAALRYKSSPDTHNLIVRRRWLFNIDSVQNGNAILVEGPLDAMRLGDGAIAMFSTAFSNEQILQLAKMRLKNVFVMFDGESPAIQQAYKLAYRLAPFVEHVEVIEMPEGKDPGDMSQDEVRKLKREIL